MIFLQGAITESNAMLIVYGTPRTRASRVTWMLEEIGASYDYRPVALDKGKVGNPRISPSIPWAKCQHW